MALPADTPRPIRTLLRRCLDKDRKRRLAAAADAPLEIDEALGDALIAPKTMTIGTGQGNCRQRLGDLLKFYYRQAA
jgi:hypothetical protein